MPGGKRPGAGRKPKPQIVLDATKGIASRVLAAKPGAVAGWPGEEEQWLNLLTSSDQRLRFDVQKYLTDRRDGKPAQGVFLGDTREGAQALSRGDLPSHFPSANETAHARGTGKPN